MGTCFSIQLSGDDQTLSRIFSFLCGKGYIRNLKENLRDLEREIEDLNAIQHEVKNKVAREETQHRKRLETVKVWLDRVEKTQTTFSDLLSNSPTQLQKLCLCDLSPENICSSYEYGKRVFSLLGEVKKLKSESKTFDVVTELTPISEVEKRPTRPTIGQEEMLEKAWNRLMEGGVSIMGLHGMGGVGKTTLFNKIHNKFSEIVGRFEVVIWVGVSRGAAISKLQEDIAQKLHLCDDSWTKKNESDKASDIHRVLIGKRFVLMLDNIWKKLDLEAIGVPFPTRENGCKVAFTTRSREVCGDMGDPEPMQVKCLEWNEAWKLFENKVGDKILGSTPVIAELARKVAEKCRGLPLALDLIGGTMASRTSVDDWQDAVDVLTSSAAEFPNMRNKILPILKYSYDSLEDENIKSCFLYCALFPENSVIDPERLIDYWICEGFIKEDQVIKRAQRKGFVILRTLFRANLLTEVGTMALKMHDVVREMALWVASGLGKQIEDFVVHAKVGLHENPIVKNWGAVRRMSLMDNKIEEIACGSKCCELTTLFLQHNRLKNLSTELISSMQKLVVLDISGNYNFNELPEEISELASLHYIDLSYTRIEKLPVGFKKLKKLTQLNLTSTMSLCSVGEISKCSSLRILKLKGSNVHGDVGLLKDLKLLTQLQVLTITISTELGLETILGDQRLVNCINDVQIEGFQEKPLNISLLVGMRNMHKLSVGSSHVSDIITYMKCRESPCFTNLSIVHIFKCNSIKDLTWLVLIPNLVCLHIEKSEEVKEIINRDKAACLTRNMPFQKLVRLWFRSLPKLGSIYWTPLPFPFLRRIYATKCPKLRKLPLNAASVPRVGDLAITMDQQGTDLQWEDEDTKNRFLPSFDGVYYTSFTLGWDSP